MTTRPASAWCSGMESSMYSGESSVAVPCGRCGALGTRFYTFTSDVPPNLCPQCFRAMLRMIDTLALAEAPHRDLWAYGRN
jgi:hypothetical protein